MIVYFADRQLNVIGQASTELPEGLIVTADRKTEDVDTGVAVFECRIPFDRATRSMVEKCTEVGNYILRSHDSENEFYTIIDAEIDTKKQEVYIYAEDDGMDLLNEVVGVYEADQAYPISHYINKYAAGAGFEIGINEAEGLTRKLSWDGESTATERIASIATQFDGCEVSYSFDVDGLTVTRKYINIYRERGKDVGATLRLNYDIDRIVTTKSIANLATALQCVGGTPEDENIEDDVEPVAITLEGYEYDDGDFYVDGVLLKSREALKRWSRYLWKDDETQKIGGHIVKQFSYDTVSQQELCSRAITELKKIRDMELNYEVDITKFPDNVKVGDRINIVDDEGELYVSARVLQLETSVADQEYKATLGEYLIKDSGISAKVAELAALAAANAAANKKAYLEAKKATESIESMGESTSGWITNTDDAVGNLADSIANIITDANGQSLMSKDGDRWTFSIGDIENTLSSATNNINNLTGDVSQTKTDVENIKQSLEELGVMANYVRIDISGPEPLIELGKSENEFKVRITNTEIHFADGTVIPTRITRQMMIIEKAMMRDGLQFGDDEEEGISGVWILKRRSNGNLGLLWKEVNG